MAERTVSRYCRRCGRQVDAIRDRYKPHHILLMVLTLPLWIMFGFGYAYEPPPGWRCPHCSERVFRRRPPRGPAPP